MMGEAVGKRAEWLVDWVSSRIVVLVVVVGIVVEEGVANYYPSCCWLVALVVKSAAGQVMLRNRKDSLGPLRCFTV